MWWLIAGLVTAGIVLLVCWSKLDCNVQLAFYERFGKSSKDLQGKVVWIIGASSGIGESLALELAQGGAKLMLSGRRTSRLMKVKEKCVKLTRQDISILQLDVTDTNSHPEKLQQVLAEFGHIDILINNAGRFQNNYFELCDLEEERRTFDINFFGLVNLTRLVVNQWLSVNQPGHIAVTGSGAAITASPTSSTYAASKHALRAYFESLALELFHRHITVTMACPGPVSTELWDRVSCGLVGAELVQKNPTSTTTFLTADRCALLIAIAISNRISECWIAKQPLLTILYISQYFKSFFQWAIKRYITEATRLKVLNMQE